MSLLLGIKHYMKFISILKHREIASAYQDLIDKSPIGTTILNKDLSFFDQ